MILIRGFFQTEKLGQAFGEKFCREQLRGTSLSARLENPFDMNELLNTRIIIIVTIMIIIIYVPRAGARACAPCEFLIGVI